MTSRLVGISLIAGVVQAESNGIFRWDNVFFGRRETKERRTSVADTPRGRHNHPLREGE